MNNLRKLASLWTNLDEQYEELKDKLNVNSKAEFLKALCFDRNGNSIIPKIKMSLSKDVNNYTTEESIIYTNLIECLNAVDNLISTSDLNTLNIKSLNSFVMQEILKSKDSVIDKRIDEEYLDNVFVEKDNIKYLSSKDAFSMYGVVRNTCRAYRSNIVKIVIDEDFNNDFISINLDTNAKLAKCLQDVSNTSPLLAKVPYLIELLKKENSLPDSMSVSDISNYDNKEYLLSRKVKEVRRTENYVLLTYRGESIFCLR